MFNAMIFGILNLEKRENYSVTTSPSDSKHMYIYCIYIDNIEQP